MHENESAQPPEKIHFPKETSILCVCNNGHSRSKYMLRALAQLGYRNTSLLGIQNPHFSKEEKTRLLHTHQIILCAADDVASMVRFFIEKEDIEGPSRIISLKLSERLHQKITASLRGDIKTKPLENNEEMVGALKAAGFYE